MEKDLKLFESFQSSLSDTNLKEFSIDLEECSIDLLRILES